MTPKPTLMRLGGPSALGNQLRESRISDADLKEEIIKDLTDQKYRHEGSKKQMRRNVSSQFSNYVDRRASNSRLAKPELSVHMSERSAVKAGRESAQPNLVGGRNGKENRVDEASGALLRSQTDQSPLGKPVRESSAAKKARQSQPETKASRK